MALRAGALSLLLLSSTAIAGTIGTATVNDVTLGDAHAGLLSYGNGINPQSQGAGGGSTGFASAFSSYGSGDWMRLAAFGVNADDGESISTAAFGSALRFSFDKSSGRAGIWTLTNADLANAVELDLVFALHTGGGSGAWMFDEQKIGAGQTLHGTWALNLFNNGGKYSGYSNLTVFGRNFDATPIVATPPVVTPPVVTPPVVTPPVVTPPVVMPPVVTPPVVTPPVVTPPVVTPPVVPPPVVTPPVVTPPVVTPPVVTPPVLDPLPPVVAPSLPPVLVTPTPTDVPEPGTPAIFALGLGLLGFMASRRKAR